MSNPKTIRPRHHAGRIRSRFQAEKMTTIGEHCNVVVRRGAAVFDVLMMLWEADKVRRIGRRNER